MEIDPRMVQELRKRFMSTPLGSKLQIIEGNCLKNELPFFNVCVANVPYAISSALVFKLLRHRPLFRCAVLMFQREFAMRLCAKSGSSMYCRLSSNTQLLSRVDHLMKISKASFKPPPKVESSVVRIEPKRPAPEVAFDVCVSLAFSETLRKRGKLTKKKIKQEWDGMVKICFNRPNKTLAGNFRVKSVLKNLYTIHTNYCKMLEKEPKPFEVVKELIPAIMAKLHFSERRMRTMEEDELLAMLAAFHAEDIYFA